MNTDSNLKATGLAFQGIVTHHLQKSHREHNLTQLFHGNVFNLDLLF